MVLIGVAQDIGDEALDNWFEGVIRDHFDIGRPDQIAEMGARFVLATFPLKIRDLSSFFS
ncbi:MAG: hypothetical protein ACKV22_25565 [Bryobacteraceae bacterium]